MYYPINIQNLTLFKGYFYIPIKKGDIFMSITINQTKEEEASELNKLLLSDPAFTHLPQLGDVIKGKVVSASAAEVKVDLNGLASGVIRGRELYNESEEYGHLKPGDEVEATVVEPENEHGDIELSFRFAGHQKAWDDLIEAMKKDESIEVTIFDANRGGLMAKVGHIKGFMPVSQLIPEHYPRVEGGDKAKILEHLKSFVNQKMKVKVLDADPDEEKLIVSEKLAWENVQKKMVSKFKVGDTVEAKATAITDFGVFLEFGDNMEGLVHISELAWQRIDDPHKIVSVGEKVKAQIIKIEGTKIFLSFKSLKIDPWAEVAKKYKQDSIVEGTVLKVNPFGLFVELDKDIHGLAHISELADKPVKDVTEIAKPGDVLKFRVITIEPKDHRLGLSLKLKPDKKADKVKAKEETEDKPKVETKEKENSEDKPKVETKEKENTEDKPKEK